MICFQNVVTNDPGAALGPIPDSLINTSQAFQRTIIQQGRKDTRPEGIFLAGYKAKLKRVGGTTTTTTVPSTELVRRN